MESDQNNGAEITVSLEMEMKVRNVVEQIFSTVLGGWMFGYGKTYGRDHFIMLHEQLHHLVKQSLPLRFLLPAFHSKSSNREAKVLGSIPDLAEFLAIRSLTKTCRKLEEIYPQGVLVTILSDYIFGKYIGVSEEDYTVYHKELKQMVYDAGANDIIEVISLSCFDEFNNICGNEISTKLLSEYGDPNFLTSFDESVKSNSSLMTQYLSLREFMAKELSHTQPDISSSGSQSLNIIENGTRAMMSQGAALRKFLKEQEKIKNFIPLSIHEHNPELGQFAIDLFKHSADTGGILRTPWDHVVVFDSMTGEFIVEHKENILIDDKNKHSFLVKAQYQNRDWFYLKLYLSEEHTLLLENEEIYFDAKVNKQGCGLMVVISTKTISPPKSDFLHPQSLTTLIKEFGVVVLRGLEHFENEEEYLEKFSKRATHGIVKWPFGFINKIVPDGSHAGIISTKHGLHMHFDMAIGSAFMGIDQSKHRYEDYVPREFLLYCRSNLLNEGEGPTTFIDCHGAALSLNGAVNLKWKKTILSYETKLANKENKALYFGGSDNTYKYPLIHACPWTGKDVLRWLEQWTDDDHPGTPQYFTFEIISCPDREAPTPADVDAAMRKIAFDDRFYFEHSYQEGDQVYVNNYTMLHGRRGFSSPNRELWRLQAIPPSNNLPDYLRELKVSKRK